MRSLALLLFTTTLSAQWVSSIEQSYGPYARPSIGGRLALGGDGNRVLLAWSESVPAPRIHVGLLDSRGRLISPIAVLPVEGDTAEAYAPAVGFNGESFFVAWIESYRSAKKLRGMRIDDTGTPVGAPQAYGSKIYSPPPASEAKEPPALQIVWDGAAWNVWSSVQATATHNGVLATASTVRQPLWMPGDLQDVYIAWTAGEKSGRADIAERRSRGSWTASTPSVSPVAEDFAVAWCSFKGVGVLVTRDNGHSTTVSAEARLDVAPGLACDDEQCLVAYGTLSGDVHALVLDTDHLFGPMLLTIAATERKENAPQVHSLGGGRFLVAYLSDQGSDQSFRGRIVLTRPVRRRAVR